MFNLIFLVVILLNNIFANETTHDPEFEKKFQVTHIKEGDGKTFPKKGDHVYVHYNGFFLDGKKFDSSYEKKAPFHFNLGVGQVVKCWDISVARLSLGEKIKVVCPYNLAYGERGVGSIIPPKTDLVYEMELVNIGGNTDL